VFVGSQLYGGWKTCPSGDKMGLRALKDPTGGSPQWRIPMVAPKTTFIRPMSDKERVHKKDVKRTRNEGYRREASESK
jgi:hypothetical protein